MTVVLMLVIGLIAVAALIAAGSMVTSDAEDSVNNSINKTGGQITKGTCSADCRNKFPSGGAEYESCKSNC
jgi:hypothetical protein